MAGRFAVKKIIEFLATVAFVDTIGPVRKISWILVCYLVTSKSFSLMYFQAGQEGSGSLLRGGGYTAALGF